MHWLRQALLYLSLCLLLAASIWLFWRHPTTASLPAEKKTASREFPAKKIVKAPGATPAANLPLTPGSAKVELQKAGTSLENLGILVAAETRDHQAALAKTHDQRFAELLEWTGHRKAGSNTAAPAVTRPAAPQPAKPRVKL